MTSTLSQPLQGVAACRMVQLSAVRSATRGELTFIEAERDIPFEVRRVYYLYDVPAGESRGGHAHLELQQFLVAVSGSLTVVVKDGRDEERFTLWHPSHGLYLPRMVWRELECFSGGAVCMVLASQHYDESDYIREWEAFAAVAGAQGPAPRVNGRRR